MQLMRRYNTTNARRAAEIPSARERRRFSSERSSFPRKTSRPDIMIPPEKTRFIPAKQSGAALG